MNYFDIHKLNRCLPRQAHPPANSEHGPLLSFLAAYNDPAFGWEAARRLRDAQCFPIWPEGKVQWVYLAWMMMRDPRWEHDERFEAVVMACEINKEPKRKPDRESLEAALISPGSTIRDMARKGIAMGRADLIEAYDALFFNVIDRREDAQFLRNLVYPCTQLDETVTDYSERLNFGKTLLRIGYNRGLEDVLRVAGYNTASATQPTGSQASAMLQSQVMNTAYFLATAGFLNHNRVHGTIAGARALAQADKLSGQDMGGEASAGVFGEIAGAFLEEDAQSMERAAHAIAMKD